MIKLVGKMFKVFFAVIIFLILLWVGMAILNAILVA